MQVEEVEQDFDTSFANHRHPRDDEDMRSTSCYSQDPLENLFY